MPIYRTKDGCNPENPIHIKDEGHGMLEIFRGDPADLDEAVDHLYLSYDEALELQQALQHLMARHWLQRYNESLEKKHLEEKERAGAS
jgi:hypothetical protein